MNDDLTTKVEGFSLRRGKLEANEKVRVMLIIICSDVEACTHWVFAERDQEISSGCTALLYLDLLLT